MSSLTGNQATEFIDGSPGVHSFVSSNANLGTLQPATNLRTVAFISILTKGNTLAQITSVTDSEGFTWHKACSVNQSGITEPTGMTGNPLTMDMEWWYTDAFVSTDVVSPTTYHLTIGTDNDVDSVAINYGVHKDVDLTQPLDQNASFPAGATQMSSSTATASVSGKSTNTSNIQVCVGYGAVGPGQRVCNTGDPVVGIRTSGDYGQGDTFHLNQNFHIFGCAIYDETAALSSVTIHTTSATNNQMMLAFVLTQDVQNPPLSLSYGVVIT